MKKMYGLSTTILALKMVTLEPWIAINILHEIPGNDNITVLFMQGSEFCIQLITCKYIKQSTSFKFLTYYNFFHLNIDHK